MRRLKQNPIPVPERWAANMLLNDEETAQCLGLGENASKKLAEKAGARKSFGRRKLTDPAILKEYLKNMEEEE